jgi:hypothetical protein
MTVCRLACKDLLMNTFMADNGNKRTAHARKPTMRQDGFGVRSYSERRYIGVQLSDIGTAPEFTVQNTRAAVFNPVKHYGYYMYHLL